MSRKRGPQTAAKRAREQAVREKRELKEAKKVARLTEPGPGEVGAVIRPSDELVVVRAADSYGSNGS